MVTRKKFYQNQDQEGLEWTITDKDGNGVDLSTAIQIKFYCYTQDHATLLFSGTLGAEISVSGAENNIVTWAPNVTDFDQDVGDYEGELAITHAGGRVQKIQELIVEIEAAAPTS